MRTSTRTILNICLQYPVEAEIQLDCDRQSEPFSIMAILGLADGSPEKRLLAFHLRLAIGYHGATPPLVHEST